MVRNRWRRRQCPPSTDRSWPGDGSGCSEGQCQNSYSHGSRLRIAIAAAGIGCVVFRTRLPAESCSRSLISNLATGLPRLPCSCADASCVKSISPANRRWRCLVAAGLLTTGYLMDSPLRSRCSLTEAVRVLLLVRSALPSIAGWMCMLRPRRKLEACGRAPPK